MAVPKESIDSLSVNLPALAKAHNVMEAHYLRRIEHVSTLRS